MAEGAQVKSVKQPGDISSGLIAALPFLIFLIVYAFVPRFAQDKHLTMLIYIGINTMLAVALNLLMGYAGQISLGHAAFFGIGAYMSAILTIRPMPMGVIPGFSVGLGLAVGCAFLISLTRITGGKLVFGAAAMLLLSWLCGILHFNVILAIGVSGAGMVLYGIVVRENLWKTGFAGIASTATSGICHSFLARVLELGGTSPWTAMLIGMLFTGLVAYLIGGQVLRLKGHYLAMATLGFGIIVEIVFRQWTSVTGGSSDGIFGIPTIQIFNGLPNWCSRVAQAAAGGRLNPGVQYYYLVWGFVFLCLLFGVNIVRSRVGRAFRAVHGSEIAAESLGVDTSRYKVQVFVLSAAISSVAGSLYAHQAGVGYINPSEFSFGVSIQLVVMVVVGGMASIWGALFGATTIQLLKTWLLGIEKTQTTIWGLTLRGLDPIVFGFVLIVVMIVLPQGLVRGLTDLAAEPLRMVRCGRKQGVD